MKLCLNLKVTVNILLRSFSLQLPPEQSDAVNCTGNKLIFIQKFI